DPAVRAERMRVIPMRRPGEVAEVTYAILFLASDKASYITGPRSRGECQRHSDFFRAREDNHFSGAPCRLKRPNCRCSHTEQLTLNQRVQGSSPCAPTI